MEIPIMVLVTVTELDIICNEFHADQGRRIPFIYSCNNLLLCDTCNKKCGLYLVNPATREMKNIPKTPLRRAIPASRLFQRSICGFGFDNSNNEYKVVDGQIYDDYIVFSIYRLKTDYFARCFKGIHLNGAVHWLAGKIGDEYPPVIVTFLLAEEICEIPLPPISHIGPLILGVFRDCLCITFSNNSGSEEFWVMKEYKVSDSWTKMRFFMPYNLLWGPGFSNRSHDLMVYNESLIMYDFRKENGKKLQIRDMPKVGISVDVYVEGLSPLKGGEST